MIIMHQLVQNLLPLELGGVHEDSDIDEATTMNHHRSWQLAAVNTDILGKYQS